MPNAVAAPSVTIEVERKGNGVLVHCHGRLVAGFCNGFYDQVQPLFSESKRVVLDLTDLKYVDSMGLGTLVRLYVSGKSSGSCLELINLAKQVRELLGITNLLGVFSDICEKGVSMRF